LELIPCGTEVILKRSEYSGVITGISIRDNRITYGISYYEIGVYKEVWFCDYEFLVGADVVKRPLGFKHI